VCSSDLCDWTLANLLDGQVNEPQWNYRNLALGGADSAGLSIADGVKYYDSTATGNVPRTRKKVQRSVEVQPWGAFYSAFRATQPSFTMSFSGEPVVGVLPPTGTYEWFCGGDDVDGRNDDLQRTLERPISGVKAGDVLTFWTWYDLEEGCDFGYVEASSDGQTWTPLQQLSSLPAAEDGSGLPGLTGATGTWQRASYALGAFTGTVHLRFRYATDFSLTKEGWYIDDIAVGSFADPVAGQNGWAAGVTDWGGNPVDRVTDGWLLTTGVKQTNDWTADVYVPHLKGRESRYQVKPVVGVAGQGLSGQTWVDTHSFKNGVVWGIVSNHPDGGLDATGSLVVSKKGR